MGLFKKALLGTALALAMTAGSAYAVPITGKISIIGTDSYTSTSVTFGNVAFAPAASETGSFTAVGNTSNITLTNFTYSPSLSPAPVTIFSAIGNGLTAAFSLATITSVDNSMPNQLAINGVGTLSLTGFDSTVGNFQFSTQGGSGTVTFSATAAAVPEPASMALLGAGLVGLGLVRRRHAK